MRSVKNLFATSLILQILLSANVYAQYPIETFRPRVKSPSNTAQFLIQDDGKMVFMGDYAFAGDSAVANMLRFNADGSLDREFVMDPTLYTSFESDFTYCCNYPSMIQGPDGDLVLFRSFPNPRVTIIDRLGKFKKDIIAPSQGIQILDLIRSGNGYIVILQKFLGNMSILRFTANGEIDPSFTPIDFTGYVQTMAIDRNNNIMLMGSLTIESETRNLVRMSPTGTIDTSFNNISLPGNSSEITFFPDGRMLIAAFFDLLLLDANGNLIRTFTDAVDGHFVYSSAIDPVNNRVIVYIEQYPFPSKVMAFEMDGSVSSEFTPFEVRSRYSSALSRIHYNNGKFILTNVPEFSTGGDFHPIIIFDATGTIDTQPLPKPTLYSVGNVHAALPLEDGYFIVGGSFSHIGTTRVNNLAKIDRNGNVDQAFNDQHLLGPAGLVRDIEADAEGRIYVGGNFQNILGKDRTSLIRINSNGVLDETFVTTQLPRAGDSFLTDFVILNDRIIAAGDYAQHVVAFDFNGNDVPTFQNIDFGPTPVGVYSLCKIDGDTFALGGFVFNEKGFLWVMDQDGNIDNSFTQHNEVPISSNHLAKIGNDIYISGHILGSQSNLDPNHIYQYNLLTGDLKKSLFATYPASDNNHVAALNDTVVLVSGRFGKFNTIGASNFAATSFQGVANRRLSLMVSPNLDGSWVNKTVPLENGEFLMLGQFNSVNNRPFYSVALMQGNNYKPTLAMKEEYLIPEDTSFYLTDLVKIKDLDDTPTFTLSSNPLVTVNETGLIALAKDYAGPIDLTFVVSDPVMTLPPTTIKLAVTPVNDAPKLVRQVTIPEISSGVEYTITPVLMEITDVDNNQFTVNVRPGQNYTVIGDATILPTPKFSGTLTVGVVVSDGILDSNPLALTFKATDPTGVEDLLRLSFSPNPFSDHIQISGEGEIERVRLLHTNGQLGAEYDGDTLRANEYAIATNALPRGLYLLTVQLKSGETSRIKMIKY